MELTPDMLALLDERGAVVQSMSLQQKREALRELPDLEGDWPISASVRRFGRDHMDDKQFKRFIIKVTPQHMGYMHPVTGEPSECWIWTAGLHDKGYGRFYLGMDPEEPTRRIWAYPHRISFEHFIGIPPVGYIVDHQCEVKTCCNPEHLWPQTNEENLRLADERSPYKRRNQYSKE